MPFINSHNINAGSPNMAGTKEEIDAVDFSHVRLIGNFAGFLEAGEKNVYYEKMFLSHFRNS
jgi:hypothetical protein